MCKYSHSNSINKYSCISNSSISKRNDLATSLPKYNLLFNECVNDIYNFLF